MNGASRRAGLRGRGTHVIVVGGGLAGLTAAIDGIDAGAQVTLLERAPRLGGATWSFTRNGLSYDNGQHVFMRCCTAYRAFLRRIGSEGKVTMQGRMDVPVLRPGGPDAHLRRTAAPSPLHLAGSLATYRHVGRRDRLAAVRAALALRRLDLDDPALDDVAFGDWLADRGVSARARAALWDLVIRATVNLPSRDASLALAAMVFRTGLLDTNDGGDLGWSRVPLQELHGDAARRVLDGAGAVVRLGARVEAVAGATDDGSPPTVTVDGEQLAADAVVVAVPPDAAAELLPAGSFTEQDDLHRLGRSPIVNVHLLYDRRVLDEPFVAGIDSPVQFVFDRTDSSGAAAGHQALAISLSAADEYLPLSRDELVDRFRGELARLLPAARGARVVSAMVTREVAATFRGVPGSARYRPGPVTKQSGVFLAGAWTATGWPATMEGAVRSGHAAAVAALGSRALQEANT
jgi:squalene-associated FAD-dependent desaturase